MESLEKRHERSSGTVEQWTPFATSESATPNPPTAVDTITVESEPADQETATRLERTAVLDLRASDAPADESPDLENRLNALRLQEFRETHEREFLSLLRQCHFEYGFDSLADAFVEARLAENSHITMNWISRLYFEHIDDPTLAVGILRAIGRLRYEQAQPVGVSLALSAVIHADDEVKECGIRAFERWAGAESLRVLENLELPEGWIQEYADQVIQDLRAAQVADHAR